MQQYPHSGTSGQPPRVAILGLHLEANRFAPCTDRQNFVDECWMRGDEITECAYRTSNLPLEVPSFYARMDATGPWNPVPIMIAAAQPGGPISQETFNEFMEIVMRDLRAAMPVHAVYVCSHGGSVATGDDDNDGTLVAAVRRIVGAGVPLVVTHDLHCNVSDRLAADVDALVAYRTCPHVDQAEVATEAADLLRRMLAGDRLRRAFIRLPMAPAGVLSSTLDGPYADLIRLGRELSRPPVLNISLTAGFVHADLPKCGFTVNVTTLDDQRAADETALRLARAAWSSRHDFARTFTSLDEAVGLAREAAAARRGPVLLADIADNPGGGARGNTVWIMRALHEAGVGGVALGLFTDRPLAADAHEAGEGAHIEAVFNRVEDRFGRRFACGATVLRLSDGYDVGRRGRDMGRQIRLGRSALMRLDGSGLQVVVTSLREQPADPRTLEMFGIDIAGLTCVVLKSTLQYRAGFDEFFTPDRIHEVDTPGMLSPHLEGLPFERLRRPIWPLDPRTAWEESDLGVRDKAL